MRRAFAFPLLASAVTLAALFAPAPLAAQQGDFALLRVRVIDASTKAPIPGARVGFPDLELFTLSDKNGVAEIAKVPTGDRSLEVTMLGYGTATTTMKLGVREVVTGDIALTTEPIHIEGITVKGPPAKKDPKVISSAELDEPSMAHLNAYEAIQRLRPNWLYANPKKTFSTTPLSKNAVPNEPRPTDADQFPAVILDGVPGSGASNYASPLDRDTMSGILSGIKVPDIGELIFLSASDATTRYGIGFPNGAIVISTMKK
jgi:hypothetical protein